MSPTDVTKSHVIEKYVRPARERGDTTVEVRVGNVLKELGWSNRTPSVFSTLGSKSFQDEAGLQLIEKRGGPASGGPSTTWTFVYRVLNGRHFGEAKKEDVIPNGAGLVDLAGIFAGAFRELGGGEAYLKAERDWGPDAWEHYASERAGDTTDTEAK